MFWINPYSQRNQRWRWIRPPEEAKAREAIERKALEREIGELRRECDELKREFAVRRAARLREAEALRRKSDLAWERFLSTFRRYAEQQKAGFNPDQPHAPAGSAEGGQWTSGGGRFAERATPRNYSVNLKDEEAPNGIGHTIRNHVGKTDDELLRAVRERRFNFLFFSAIGKREGSFESVEAANDFVNRTLERNGPTVDLVASGKLDHEFITTRFGYVTGREAFRPSPNSEPYVRDAFGVGVLIRHDPRSERGYRVMTAYPRND